MGSPTIFEPDARLFRAADLAAAYAGSVSLQTASVMWTWSSAVTDETCPKYMGFDHLKSAMNK